MPFFIAKKILEMRSLKLGDWYRYSLESGSKYLAEMTHNFFFNDCLKRFMSIKKMSEKQIDTIINL